LPLASPVTLAFRLNRRSDVLPKTGDSEAGVIAMADEVWTWCENANLRGRTVKVKIKWANFQISTRSRSIERSIDTRDKLHELALSLVRSVFPPPKGFRLVGVTISNFRSEDGGGGVELPFRET
jgi:DNA polymerase IV